MSGNFRLGTAQPTHKSTPLLWNPGTTTELVQGLSHLEIPTNIIRCACDLRRPSRVHSGTPNIFMNSISKLSLSRDCHLMLYADDILPSNTNAGIQATNWIQRHGLTPNHQKTQYLPISRSKNGPRLTYLGVTNLSLSTHTSPSLPNNC